MKDVDINHRYTLNSGHEKFFFNKLLWLYKRYYQLRNELLNRNFNIDVIKFEEIAKELARNLRNTPYWNNWTPTPEDMYLNMARLCNNSKITSVRKEIEDNSCVSKELSEHFYYVPEVESFMWTYQEGYYTEEVSPVLDTILKRQLKGKK